MDSINQTFVVGFGLLVFAAVIVTMIVLMHRDAEANRQHLLEMHKNGFRKVPVLVTEYDDYDSATYQVTEMVWRHVSECSAEQLSLSTPPPTKESP